mmetsp:Transcript_78955/g.157796  ORF Transcript_78955/g.157796 Transcript_78955/m.157796 type:complete len:194 (+) Transcript_78955:75-656(+)
MRVLPSCTRLLSASAKGSVEISSREYPLFPIAAVAVTTRLVGSEPGRYLLVQRAKEPGKGMWSLPGGGISSGEATMAAASRELLEETGLGPSEVKFAPRPFTSTDAIYKDEENITRFHYVISQTFAFAARGSEVRAIAGDDAAAVGWFSIEEMKQMSHPGVVPVMIGVVCQAEKLVNSGFLMDKDFASTAGTN